MIALAGHGYGKDHDGPLSALAIAYFIISLTFNVIVTSLIVGRLWFVSRGTARSSAMYKDGLYTRVIVALIESGE